MEKAVEEHEEHGDYEGMIGHMALQPVVKDHAGTHDEHVPSRAALGLHDRHTLPVRDY